MSSLLDKIAGLAERWKKPISILSAIWFVVTVMAHARVIKLPELEFLKGLPATLAAGAWNASGGAICARKSNSGGPVARQWK